jgi:carbon-monoxide dehydrogenase large subunit
LVERISATSLHKSAASSSDTSAEAIRVCKKLSNLAEMRRRNLISASEMPYRLPRLEPGGPAVDTECDSGDYRETLECCLAEFGWEEKRALQGREIDGRYHGLAVACFIEGGGTGPKETGRLDLEADGTVSVYVGSTGSGRASKR